MTETGSNVSKFKSVSHNHVEEAKENIERKLRVLEHWLETGLPILKDSAGNLVRHQQTGEEQLDFVPKSIKSFLKWNSSLSCEFNQRKLKRFGPIRGTGQQTLYQYDGLLELVKVRTDAIRLLSKDVGKPRLKSNQIRQLKLEIKRLNTVKLNVEVKFRQHLQTLRQLQNELNDEIARHNSTKAMLLNDKERFEKENAVLRKENRQLIETLSKVTTVRSIEDD